MNNAKRDIQKKWEKNKGKEKREREERLKWHIERRLLLFSDMYPPILSPPLCLVPFTPLFPNLPFCPFSPLISLSLSLLNSLISLLIQKTFFYFFFIISLSVLLFQTNSWNFNRPTWSSSSIVVILESNSKC